MKHTGFFDEFLRDEVNINKSRLNTLNSNVSSVQTYLSRNLASYVKIERQGSYALRTVIKPVRDGQEYDADILLYVSPARDWKPSDYIENLYGCLRQSGTYAGMVHRKTRCVYLDYARDFHLDIVPCIVSADGKHFICNNKDNIFEESDGTGYRDWFNGKNDFTHGNLKRVVRLLKYLRDHKGNFAAKSVLLTTLIGMTVHGPHDSDDFRSLPDALVTVSNRIDRFLQSNTRMPRISNPSLPSETFTRHWDRSNYANFRKMFGIYTNRMNQAYEETEHDKSVDMWRVLFGERFGRKRGGGGRGRALSYGPGGGGAYASRPQRPWTP